MLQLPLLLLAATLAFPAGALDIPLDPGDSVTRKITINAWCSDAPVCEECPPTVPCPPLKPGKGHGGSHTAYSAAQYQACESCHAPGNLDGAIPSHWPGSFCPSQAPEFAPPELLARLGLPALTMYGQPFVLSDGTLFTDEIMGDVIYAGGKLGGYAVGETPLCVHCHQHWGSTPDALGWKKNFIHYGCLTCHKGVRNSDVWESIKQLLE